MNDVIGSIDLVCTIILKCAAASTLLSLSWAAWRVGAHDSKTFVSPQVTTGGSVTQLDVAQVVAGPAPPEEAPEAAAPHGLTPLLEALHEPIECGGCHKEIASNPITSMSVEGKGWAIYVCEHCSSQVKLPL